MLKKKIVSTIEKRTIEKQRVIIEKCFKIEETNDIVEFRGEKTLDHFEDLFEKSAKEGAALIVGHLDDLDDKDIRKMV
jgi:hypothetical protein